MRKLFMLGAVLAAVALPTASHAQSKFGLGLRLGYGVAMGDADASLSMSDYVSSQIPIQVDAMFKLSPDFELGAYLSYGFAFVGGATKDTCDAFGADCSASTTRFGLQLAYSFTKASPGMIPWIGAGIGYEWTTFSVSGGGSTDVGGWEFLNLQGGINWKLSPTFAMGPYAMYSMGQYSSIEGGDITSQKTHEWFSFGVQGKFDL